jgi:formylglycine-generating enzyme required for sulfatase activity
MAQTQAENLIRAVEGDRPDAVTLARLASLAARVEPGLLRAMRLTLLPHIPADAEADLWFSPLVDSWTPLAVVFLPEVLDVLRRELAVDQALLDAAWGVLSEFHAYAPHALRLEEEVTWLALQQDPSHFDRMQERLDAAVAAVLEQGRAGLVRWAARVFARLPVEAQRSAAGWRLAVAATSRMGRELPGDRPADAAQWLASLLPKDIPRVPIGVRLLEGAVVFGDPLSSTMSLELPRTDPLLVDVSWRGALVHSAGLTGLAFDDAGAHLAAAAEDGSIRMWEAGSGRWVANLTHESPALAVAFSPSGHLATGAQDGTVTVWDPAGVTAVARLRHPAPVRAVAFGHDGTWLATGCDDGAVRLWQLPGGEQSLRLQAESPIRALAVGPAGRIASGSDTGIRLWTETGTLLGDRGSRPVRNMAFGPRDSQLLVGTADGELVLWNPEKPAQENVRQRTEPFKTLALAPDLRAAAFADGAETVTISSLTSSNRLPVRMSAEVRALVFSPNGRFLITGLADGSVRRLDVGTGSEAPFDEQDTAQVTVGAGEPTFVGVAGDEVLLRTPLGEVFALTPEEPPPPPDLTMLVATSSATSGQLVWSVGNSSDVPELSGPQTSNLGLPIHDFVGSLEGLVPNDREPSREALRPVGDVLARVMPDLMLSALARPQRPPSGRLASVLLLADELGIPWELAAIRPEPGSGRLTTLVETVAVGTWPLTSLSLSASLPRSEVRVDQAAVVTTEPDSGPVSFVFPSLPSGAIQRLTGSALTTKTLAALLSSPALSLIHLSLHLAESKESDTLLALGDGSLARPEEIGSQRLVGAPLMVLDLHAPAPLSLVTAFLRAGAAAVLATRLAAPVETSASFLEGFYRGLADGLSAGEAVYLAIQRTGLPVFRYFGHPCLRVRPGIRVRVPADLGPPASISHRPSAPHPGRRQPGGPALDMDLVTIPGGEFFFGFTDAQARLVREAIHGWDHIIEGFLPYKQQGKSVSIHSFAIGKYPVTNAQFAEFVRDTGQQPPSHWEGEEPPERLLDHPVVQVSWAAANTFCQWLRGRTGRGFRLPTEEQWEKAARGADARLYPWGTRFEPSRVHFGKRGTAPVTAHSPEGDSPFGVADTVGNAREWTAAERGTYVVVVRGGTYIRDVPPQFLALEYQLTLLRRQALTPGAKASIGFRVALA